MNCPVNFHGITRALSTEDCKSPTQMIPIYSKFTFFPTRVASTKNCSVALNIWIDLDCPSARNYIWYDVFKDRFRMIDMQECEDLQGPNATVEMYPSVFAYIWWWFCKPFCYYSSTSFTNHFDIDLQSWLVNYAPSASYIYLQKWWNMSILGWQYSLDTI